MFELQQDESDMFVMNKEGILETLEQASKRGWNKFKGGRLDSVGIVSFSCVVS